MKKRRICVTVICLCIALLFTACDKRTDVEEGDSFIYCLNEDRTGLVKVRYDITQEDTLEAAEAMLKELGKPAEEITYTQVFPEPVKAEECELKGSILYVDFNSEYLKIKSLEEKLIRAAAVQSLLEIDGISGVRFLVEGEDLKDSEGNKIGLMNGDDFVQNTGSSPNAYQTTSLTLYFANGKGDKLVAQTMDVRYSSNTSKEKLIVEKLMQGPKRNGAYPTINPAANLLGVTIKDDICYVNFDSEFLNSTYDVLPEITIYSIVNSLVEGTSAASVQITVNGEPDTVYLETVDLSKPLQAEKDWIEEK